MTTSRVAALLEVPYAKLVIERLQAILKNEAQQRKEFREQLRDNVKTEFINGEVVIHPPANLQHINASENLFILLKVYVNKRDLGEVNTEKALVLLSRNDYEPDICYWNKEIAASFHDDQMEHPAPDLIVEILSRTTTGRDRGIKFEDYAAHGVREYWIIDPVRQSLEQYKLDDDLMAFEEVAVLFIQDTLESQTIPGFRIPVRAIFDKTVNMNTLQELMKK
jgi:Uma2 family endonuclease